MKSCAFLLILLSSAAVAVPPGYVITPTMPPPPMAISNSPLPPTVVNAITGAMEQPQAGASVAYPPLQEPSPPGVRIVAGPQPRKAAQDYLAPGDYPAAALAMHAAGTVRFALMVTRDGRVADCLITASASPPLDQATCRIMVSRARFTPARDSNGNAADAVLEQQVTWTLP